MFNELVSNVFLCISNGNKFECKQFENFIEADKYFRDHCNYGTEYSIKSTMIDRCKFYPDSFRQKTLKKELQLLFKDFEDVTIVKEFDKKYINI
jgi:hypothetical protein